MFKIKMSSLMLLISIAIGGCGLGRDKKESFAKEYFVNFPEVKNIVKYLEIDKNTITTISDSKETLEIFFKVNEDQHNKLQEYVAELIDKSFSTSTYSDSSEGDFYELRTLPNVLIHISFANGEFFEEKYSGLIEEDQIEELKNSELLGFVIQLNRINTD